MPYSFRPFWQPNSQGGPAYADISLLSQKLDTAEKKVFEYAQLSVSKTFHQTSAIDYCHSCIALRGSETISGYNLS
jgi:hypothetical protein